MTSGKDDGPNSSCAILLLACGENVAAKRADEGLRTCRKLTKTLESKLFLNHRDAPHPALRATFSP